MSLIIGIRCIDGVVIGADSSATFGSIGRNTIRQNARKIAVVEVAETKAVIACAGPAGIAQAYRGALEDLIATGIPRASQKTVHETPPHVLMKCLQETFFKYTEPSLKALAIANKVFPHIAHEMLGSAIIAMPCGTGINLFSLDQVCSPEMASDHLPFVSMGSGQFIADPFLAFLKRVVWQDKRPKMPTGILSTVWTLSHAIDTNPGGIGGQIHITTLQHNTDGKLVALDYDDNLLKPHYEAIKKLESTLGSDIRKTFEQAEEESSEVSHPPTFES